MSFLDQHLAGGRVRRPAHWGAPSRPDNAIFKAYASVVAWHRRARERMLLMEMSDHHLRDIGLTRDDALREWAKPFWRD